MNKKKKWIITAIVLVVFCLILSLYNLLNDKAPASDDAAKAPIAPRRQSTLNVNGRIVRPQRLTDGITTVGNLLPDEEVDLSFETSGKIVAINFQEGTVVRKGELLAKVNDLPLVAQLSRYEAQLKLAEDRVYRQSALLKKDAVSQEAYEQARTELAMLNADIDIVKSNIALTELRAPFDGVIGLRNVSEGAYASPSVVVAKLTKISPLKIDFFVPERYANQIKPGTRLSFTIEGRQERFEAAVYRIEGRHRHPHAGRPGEVSQYAGQTAAGTLCDGADPHARNSRRHRHPDRSPRAGDGRRQGIPLQGRQGARRGGENRTADRFEHPDHRRA